MCKMFIIFENKRLYGFMTKVIRNGTAVLKMLTAAWRRWLVTALHLADQDEHTVGPWLKEPGHPEKSE